MNTYIFVMIFIIKQINVMTFLINKRSEKTNVT